MTDIIETIHAALEAHLPSIADDDARQAALRYLRGLKTYLASRPSAKLENVISMEDYVIRTRVQRAVRSQRRRALADARHVLQHKVNVFGDPMYDDDIE